MEGNRRRSALAEIPVRMSQLRVSTDETPIGLNRTAVDSPMDNITDGHLTPSPSQDEREYPSAVFGCAFVSTRLS